MPAWMRWSVLIDADLSKLGGEVRLKLFAEAKRNFDCIVSWRKDRHSENGLAIPYRMSVRGVEAQCCMEWLLESLCSDYGDVMDTTDIWSTPSPEENQQTKVQLGLEGVIVRVFPESVRHRSQESQGAAILRPAPQVYPQSFPGLVQDVFSDLRRIKEEA